MRKLIKTPTKRVVDDRANMQHGKVVIVKAPFDIVDGQVYYDCWCEDNSGGGLLPENILKPIPTLLVDVNENE